MSENRGIVLYGNKVAQEIREMLQASVKRLREEMPGFAPSLAIVQVGEREDSKIYIRMKMKAAEEIGIKTQHIQLPNTTTEAELLSLLDKLNGNDTIHGIIVQMPLNNVTYIDPHLVTDSVSPEKDVDGLGSINQGRLSTGNLIGFVPCTPQGCVELIRKTGVPIAGAKAVILGRSKIVGTPLSELLKWENATVTVCHSRTKDLMKETIQADILVAAIGRPEFIRGAWIKPGAVVIDCGINTVPDNSKECGYRLVGDVAFEEAKAVASYITPVPGGVGPMTVAMLMKNTFLAAKRALETSKKS